MFDINRTIKLVTGALTNAQATWQSYRPDASDWKKTAFLLTGPLIVAAAVISYLLSLVFSDSAMFPQLQPTLLSTVGTIIMGAIGACVVAFIFSALAGVFGGKSSFALGLAAATLAFVPGYVGQALSWLPWIGGLLSIGLGIFALVQLWKIIPLYLEVPDGKRALHYIVSLVATIVVMVLVGSVVSPILYGPDAGSPFDAVSRMESSSSPDSSAESSGGMFRDIGRAAAIMEEAEKDTYDPPADGKLTERQMRDYVAVMQAVAAERAKKMEEMEAMAEKVDEDGEVSMKDIGSMMGMAGMGGMMIIEIEAVRSNGGNWAEHKWVRDSLSQVMMRSSGSEAIEHNYSLYQKYADQLRPSANQ